MKSVLVLSSADSPENVRINDTFVSNINKQAKDYQLTWCHYNDVAFVFDQHTTKAFLLPEYKEVVEFDMVYFKSYYRYAEQAQALAEVLTVLNIPFVCSELSDYISFSKLSQYARFARHALPIPKTMFISQTKMAQNYDAIVCDLGSPFVMKASDGKGGDANFLITDEDHFSQVISEHQGVDFVLQSFVPNEYDMRLLVLNSKVELVIKRQRQDASTHLNNTSQGAEASLINPAELSADVLELAHQAAALMKREIAGVDIMLNSQTGQPVLIEVNASPQVGSGAFQEEKIDLYNKMFYNTLFKS